MKVMVVAGEASGDLHGANLAKKLHQLVPSIQLFGMGGRLMEEAGVSLLYNPTKISSLGLVEVLKSAQLLRRVLLRLGDEMDRRQPDVIVLIDFPGFNMKLADMAHRRGIPVVYFISPSAWAWGRGRAEKVARNVNCVCSIFPFEADVYNEAGANVCYVGHPLLDIVSSKTEKREFLSQIGLNPDKPMFALLPGSREQEVRQLLPGMLKAARLISAQVPEAQFVVPLAHTVSRQLIEGFSQDKEAPPVVLVEGQTHDVMAAADVAIIASGTATLEAAILGTPLVMVYKVAGSTYRVFKLLVKISLFALPNIVAGRKIVEELLQADANPKRMAEEVLKLWNEPERRAQMKQDMAEVVRRLGSSGAVERTAQAILAVAKGEDPLQYSVAYSDPVIRS